MWREEGLGFWLQKSRAPKQIVKRTRLASVAAAWLRLPDILPSAIDVTTCIYVEKSRSPEVYINPPVVADRLGFVPSLEGTVQDMKGKTLDLDVASAGMPAEVEGLPDVRSMELPIGNNVAGRREKMLASTAVRLIELWRSGKEGKPRSLELLVDLPAAAEPGGWALPRNMAVRLGMAKISGLPHIRAATDLNGLGANELDNLLREAELLKQIPHGDGELLAFFSAVPVEIVLRARFLEVRKQLAFTLAPTNRVARTRVHDTMAVKDRRSGEIHIVPHRTRYRTAFLS
jgi:hypothetical protein